jgi:hypothetical protein
VAPYLRKDEILPDEAVVVKGGEVRSRSQIDKDAERLFAFLESRGEDGAYGTSVCSLPDLTARQIAEAVTTTLLPHPRMRVSGVAVLRGYGFEVVPSGRPGHATLIFAEAPTDEDWNHLQEAFSEPEENPVARKARNG